MDGWCDCSYIPWDVQGLDQIYLFFYYTMEKLLQLLNEYLWQSGIVAIDQEIEWGRDIFFENVDWFHAEEAEIISKKFWFIEWLVLNMKINTDELMRHWHIVKTYDLDEPWDSYGYVDSLLMLLTIQDEPIDFLNSILK